MAGVITDHVWSIGKPLDAVHAVAPPAPITTETAPDRRRHFQVILMFSHWWLLFLATIAQACIDQENKHLTAYIYLYISILPRLLWFQIL